MAMVKEATIYMRTVDNLKQEAFGMLVCKDASEEHHPMVTIKSCSIDIHTQKARKDWWKRVCAIEDIDAIVMGLVQVPRKFVSTLI